MALECRKQRKSAGSKWYEVCGTSDRVNSGGDIGAYSRLHKAGSGLGADPGSSVTNTIMRQGVPTIINPYDLFSLEEAMRLRDKLGGEVTVLSMGPPSASDSLRKALTHG